MAKIDNEVTLEKEELRSVIQRLQADNIALKEDITSTKHLLEELVHHPRHEEDPVQIAFSVASHEPFGPAGTNDTNIPYEIIYTNVGDGWDSVLSAFQAPVTGLYQFSASMRSNSDYYAYCHIVHSSQTAQTKVASMFGNILGIGISGDANYVIIDLEQGDYVSVQLENNDGAIDSYSFYVFSTFSGFLLFQN